MTTVRGIASRTHRDLGVLVERKHVRPGFVCTRSFDVGLTSAEGQKLERGFLMKSK
jgi:hypothetical protein